MNANNTRKAAILIRSLDAETAAGLLAQLSPVEAKAVRAAIQSLGAVDDDERADVVAEFRSAGPIATEEPSRGVELHLSTADFNANTPTRPTSAPSRPFEFLEQARVESLVPYLSREHGQTVAIVLSYLPPARAAQVLAALPARLQGDALERLTTLGESDPECVEVIERELANWLDRQQASRPRELRRTDAAASILAAADESARGRILKNLVQHNHRLAEQLAPSPPPSNSVAKAKSAEMATPGSSVTTTNRIPEPPKPRPTMPFANVAQLDRAALAATLRSVDSEMLVLALVGASNTLVDRVTDEMPRALAAEFRRRLRHLGPMRLRDVETAQQEVASVAAQVIAARRQRHTAAR